MASLGSLGVVVNRWMTRTLIASAGPECLAVFGLGLVQDVPCPPNQVGRVVRTDRVGAVLHRRFLREKPFQARCGLGRRVDGLLEEIDCLSMVVAGAALTQDESADRVGDSRSIPSSCNYGCQSATVVVSWQFELQETKRHTWSTSCPGVCISSGRGH